MKLSIFSFQGDRNYYENCAACEKLRIKLDIVTKNCLFLGDVSVLLWGNWRQKQIVTFCGILSSKIESFKTEGTFGLGRTYDYNGI